MSVKKVFCIICVLLCLTGCAGEDSMDRALALRSRFQQSGGCTFQAEITADYGQTLHTFVLDCIADPMGSVGFTVVSPESISGITGEISVEGGKLTFDDKVLAFQTLAQGQINPVSAPWVIMRCLSAGYLTAAGEEEELLRLSINDSYEQDALHTDIWLDKNDLPVYGEILWEGRRILSVKVENFVFV